MFSGLGILTLWGLYSGGVIALPDILLVSTISRLTLIVQLYFRKKPQSEARSFI